MRPDEKSLILPIQSLQSIKALKSANFFDLENSTEFEVSFHRDDWRKVFLFPYWIAVGDAKIFDGKFRT